jgi:hypothetical protein
MERSSQNAVDPETVSIAALLITLALTNLASVWVAVNYVA